MTSLGAIAKGYSIFVFILIGILVAFLIYRVYEWRVRGSSRTSLFILKGLWFPKCLKLLLALALLLVISTAPVLVLVRSPFTLFIPAYQTMLLVLLIVLVCGFELFLSMSMSDPLIKGVTRKVILAVAVAVLLPLSVFMSRGISELFVYPPESDCYLVDLPVRGNWRAGHAGGTESVNYHNAIKGQMYAIDILKMGEDGRIFKRSGTELSDFYAMGADVYSPVTGVVVQVVDSMPNIDVSMMQVNSGNPAGNHVVIGFEPDRYVFLAHFDKGSIQVKKGDRVTSGDLIARVGNSGNTTQPHLHMHIQDTPEIDFEVSRGYPFRFREMQRKRWFWWSDVSKGFLVRNDVFSQIVK